METRVEKHWQPSIQCAEWLTETLRWNSFGLPAPHFHSLCFLMVQQLRIFILFYVFWFIWSRDASVHIVTKLREGQEGDRHSAVAWVRYFRLFAQYPNKIRRHRRFPPRLNWILLLLSYYVPWGFESDVSKVLIAPIFKGQAVQGQAVFLNSLTLEDRTDRFFRTSVSDHLTERNKPEDRRITIWRAFFPNE
jgi:hypothetical protein